MPDAVDSAFNDLRYPGSRHPRRLPVAPARPAEDAWDAKPVIKTVKGVKWELFTIGQLATALGGRAAVTIRLWERDGVLPRARIRLANKNGKGGRRYYTRAQVETARKVAEAYGMLEPRARIHPNFAPDLLAAWKKLEEQR